MKKSSHMIVIIKLLLTGEKVASRDRMASNTNQYFCKIKSHGIKLVEVWQPNLENAGRHKKRSLQNTHDNIEKAKKYLEALQGVKHKQDATQNSA